MMSCRAFAADPFYEQRLQMGKVALAAQRHVQAAQELRIGAFGLLDEPKRLAETLALLALAHAGTGRTEDLQKTLERFIEVETRFKSWDASVLDPAQRKQFEMILIRVIPRPTLVSITSLAPLVQPVAAAATADRGAGRSAKPAPTPVMEASRTTKQAMDEATALVGTRRFADAVTILSDAVGRDGSNRDLRLRLMQVAVLATNWPAAAAQLPLVSPFTDSEPVPMFYAAITLFETGRLTDARQMLNRALPRITRSPFVDQYAGKISGAKTGS